MVAITEETEDSYCSNEPELDDSSQEPKTEKSGEETTTEIDESGVGEGNVVDDGWKPLMGNDILIKVKKQ
jgi:hypothetical protein